MSKDKNRNNIDIDNTNYKYHDSDARIFLENLSKELSLVTQDPEIMEREHFTIDGKVLCPEAKITYEMIRVLNEFVYQYEPSTDFTREDRIRNLIESAMKCIESEDYDYDTITQLLVHIELELGMPVLLTTADAVPPITRIAEMIEATIPTSLVFLSGTAAFAFS